MGSGKLISVGGRRSSARQPCGVVRTRRVRDRFQQQQQRETAANERGLRAPCRPVARQVSADAV